MVYLSEDGHRSWAIKKLAVAGPFGYSNLDQLPATGAVVIAAPLKIVHGSGSPLRVLAIAPS